MRASAEHLGGPVAGIGGLLAIDVEPMQALGRLLLHDHDRGFRQKLPPDPDGLTEVAAAAAEPPDEPPGTTSRFHGLWTGP